MTLAERIARSIHDDELEAFREATAHGTAPLASIADIETCAYCGTPEGVRYDRRADLYLCPHCGYHGAA